MAGLVTLLIVGCAVALAAGYARTRLILVVVDGDSMRPLIAAGTRVLVRRTRRCRRGDIVLLRPWRFGPPMVKQVVAVAGDPVPAEFRPVTAAATVPDGMLLIRGTAPDSMDSRQLGPLATGDVVGVVLGRRPPIPAPAAPGGAPRLTGGV